MSDRGTKKAKKGAGFLDEYRLEERYLLKPNAALGRPGIIEALSPTSDPVLIRIWPRRTKDDSDLLDIWHHELRQLHRLGGYPGAQKYIARVKDAGSDPKGFYIVLDAGQRQPLETLLGRSRGAAEWLRTLSLPANRFRLWTNLRRVARGLEILHNEGLVHRNLDGWAILTSAGTDPDFQLTGFEWSLRLMSTSDTPMKGRGPEIPSVSFSADWEAFSRLAARIFNVREARLVDRLIPDYEVHESATASEIRLLRDLLQPAELPRIDGELVVSRIDQLLETLDASRASEEGRYHLVLRMGTDSDLSRVVREASNLAIEISDTDAQLAWIQADLGPVATLAIAGEEPETRLFVRGRELVYRVKQYRGIQNEPTWQFGFCESAEFSKDWDRKISGYGEILANALHLLPHASAKQSYQRIRGRAPSWVKQIERLRHSTPARITREGQLHRALSLLHALEIAFSAATTFPVTVVQGKKDENSIVELIYRSNPEREELAKALGLNPPLQRLKEGLEMEELGEGEGWSLTETARLGQTRGGDLELTYEGAGIVGVEPSFKFRTPTPVYVSMRDGYLLPGGARGNFIQFRRRSRALRLLKEHTELLSALADPRGQLMQTHDTVNNDPGYAQLDEAKQKALKDLLAVLPMYLLQGPPGVGKTFLVKELIRRRFDEDRSQRLLVTAQGNHALDHLLDELADLWKVEPGKSPLVVRCRPRDDRTAGGSFDLYKQTAQIVSNLARMPFARMAPPSLQARLSAFEPSDGDARTSSAAERRSLEGLVMRSANLVFATTNSAELERLVEERGQFDWTIVEEAGKATGCELVTPLMLSHRRLLIGDHKQLPPFGALQLEKVLDNKAGIREAFAVLPRLLDGAVRHLIDDDLLEFIEDEAADLEALCTEAKRALYLFETALTAELERQERRLPGQSIASTLHVQHRMHPTICELVSKSFYGTLVTSDAREREAYERAKWIASRDPDILPDHAVVLVDMQYERSAVGQARIEQLPRFTNEEEVAEVVRSVAQLTVTCAAARPPTLVILAPYARQVRRLKEAVLGDPRASAALAAFRPVARGNEWCSTVDAFQGNEADVVVFSLVRNNRGATIRRALGFVGDARRFNVLLSRARQRLIFVGSWEFLQTVARPMGLEKDVESEFLRKFLTTLDAQLRTGKAARVSGGVRRSAQP